eukprot:CAMPEP_0201961736 /NCGR_PEP_ID=MMETSP0904-20121228/8112_1 /ASSEMBLY_ACC=CAM_ASM_000553 /TAXON_ID=420261 /ORGANISM="Thalassiosira antarctica, Strain CCMP982" /LENGTH=434 /DNA_ID=CAMNT_0048507981 /DNA_START=78 /DNA_END=1382 /DNA_ORIENTATION=+
MVLFSRQSRTPLAALTLKAKDIGCLSMLTGRPSPKDATQPHFQGLLNMPDQSFSFVITNLSDDGMLNFNILHTPHRVSEVDPGPSYGINEVNELHPNQSYEIEADQRTNRAMVLMGKTEEKFDPISKQKKVVPLTVDRSESAKDKTKEGLYFHLSVVPDNASPTLVKKFKEGTVWKAVSGFVRKTLPSPRRNEDNLTRRPMLLDSAAFGSAPLPPPGPPPSAFGSSVSLGLGLGLPLPSFRSSSSSQTRPPASARRPVSTSARSSRLYGSRCFERSQGDIDQDFTSLDQGVAFAANVDVGSTQAGELTYGEHINVCSGYTGHEYAYEYASEPTVLCMSIWTDLKFLPLVNTIEKMLEAEVEEWMDNEGKALIESLNAIFKEDKRVLDLESEADTIICACGHQCINHKNVSSNLRRCPLCRSPVTAFVRADGIVI